MVDAHPLPPGLEPDLHEHGLASGDLGALAAAIDRGWELFEVVATEVDPDAPSRKNGWTARELIARLGQWDFTRTLQDVLRDAHDGDADYFDADAIDEQVRTATADLPTPTCSTPGAWHAPRPRSGWPPTVRRPGAWCTRRPRWARCRS